MESIKNGVKKHDEGFPWHNLPRKDRICRILSYYCQMRSHTDRDEFYSFLKSELEKLESGSTK